MKVYPINCTALVSFLLIFLFVISAVFAPALAPQDPNRQDMRHRASNPCPGHPLGTDSLGRDVLSRMLYGGRLSLLVGILPAGISMSLGTALGLISGYLGKKIDSLIMRIADVLMAFPSLLLAMLISYTLGKGLLTICIALSFAGWAPTARIVRSQVLALREKEYVEAAVSIGVSPPTIILRHILPNCIPTLIVLFTMSIPENILAEASLSFLGIGAQPPSASWGLLVFEMKRFLTQAPVPTLAPGVAILLLVMAFHFLGDGLSELLDPALRQ